MRQRELKKLKAMVAKLTFAQREELRVGGGVTPAVLPHHRTCGSASGGSLNTLESSHRIEQRHQT